MLFCFCFSVLGLVRGRIDSSYFVTYPEVTIKSIDYSMGIRSVSSDIPPSAGWTYDVFLSFRGEDTRKSFTDHLYAALYRKGLHVFRDDKGLERGEVISARLSQAIEESRYSIIVFSRNYAYSTWCLGELVRIVKCKNTSDQRLIFPIFYDVEPTVVRKQTSSFKKLLLNMKKILERTRKRCKSGEML